VKGWTNGWVGVWKYGWVDVGDLVVGSDACVWGLIGRCADGWLGVCVIGWVNGWMERYMGGFVMVGG